MLTCMFISLLTVPHTVTNVNCVLSVALLYTRISKLVENRTILYPVTPRTNVTPQHQTIRGGGYIMNGIFTCSDDLTRIHGIKLIFEHLYSCIMCSGVGGGYSSIIIHT